MGALCCCDGKQDYLPLLDDYDSVTPDLGPPTTTKKDAEMDQLQILNNSESRRMSLALCTLNVSGFLRFTDTHCSSIKATDTLWATVFDCADIGYIETSDQIAHGIAFIAMLYKRKLWKRTHHSAYNREMSNYEVKNTLAKTQHIAVWIVRKYGNQREGCVERQPYFLMIDKEKWRKNLPKWIKEYVQSKGYLTVSIYGKSI